MYMFYYGFFVLDPIYLPNDFSFNNGGGAAYHYINGIFGSLFSIFIYTKEELLC
ncbi:hypothetical protein X953_14565 [Virgibacillus sp. SK37]|nr:hypothetical protein X953_14565 [Virgibacillus sp. SK37]